MSAAPRPLDQRNRPLRSLRLSVTDRCNLRCTYCLPRTAFARGHAFLPREDLLSPGHIEVAAAAFLRLGVRKIHLTGGEPLLRREVVEIVERIAALGCEDLALTTNGTGLRRLARRLYAAGLRRITVSLDSLDPDVFRRIADSPLRLDEVLAGISEAKHVGFSPVKLNCVLRRGINDHEVDALVDYARREGCVLRFIEYMDVGTTNEWHPSAVVSKAEILDRIARRHPLEAMPARHPDDVARRYRYHDGAGEVGIIASVTEPFCATCTRARLAADGRLYTCLFASHGTDLRPLLRQGISADALAEVIATIWTRRADRYSELRGEATGSARRMEMSYVGG